MLLPSTIHLIVATVNINNQWRIDLSAQQNKGWVEEGWYVDSGVESGEGGTCSRALGIRLITKSGYKIDTNMPLNRALPDLFYVPLSVVLTLHGQQNALQKRRPVHIG